MVPWRVSLATSRAQNLRNNNRTREKVAKKKKRISRNIKSLALYKWCFIYKMHLD